MNRLSLLRSDEQAESSRYFNANLYSAFLVVAVVTLNAHVFYSKTLPCLKKSGISFSIALSLITFVELARKGLHAFTFSLVNVVTPFSVSLLLGSRYYIENFTDSKTFTELVALTQRGNSRRYERF